MDAMPRPRPPYLQREVTRHGKTLWYRRDKGPRIRINSAFGSAEFMAEYQRAVAGDLTPKREPPIKTNSLKWLLDRYRESAAWANLSPATRRQRENIFLPILASAGKEPFAEISRQDIAEAVDRPRRHALRRRKFRQGHARPVSMGDEIRAPRARPDARRQHNDAED